jgi:hypothetical protein
LLQDDEAKEEEKEKEEKKFFSKREQVTENKNVQKNSQSSPKFPLQV